MIRVHFTANDGPNKILTLNGQGILRPKGKGKGKETMVSDFLLPWSRLNLLSLPLQQQENLASSGIPLEAVTYFEYGKTEEGYWTGENLLDQKLFTYWGSLIARLQITIFFFFFV